MKQKQKKYVEEPILVPIDEFEEKVKKDNRIYKISKRLINVTFIIIILILSMVSVDIVRVEKYNKTPIFAINLHTYKNGSKEYYGLGYKVIKYNETPGRRDIELGPLNLKYNNTPIDINDLDMALNVENDLGLTYKNYYKKFIRLESKVKKVDLENNRIIIGYVDEDHKYDLDIYCTLPEKNSTLEGFTKDINVSVIGTVEKIKKEENKKNKMYISNCFAEGYVEEVTE